MVKIVGFDEFFRIREFKNRRLDSFLRSFLKGNRRKLIRNEYIQWHLRFIGSDIKSMDIDGLLDNNVKAAYLALCITNPGGRVIDVGCGIGVSTLALLYCNRHDVIAVDPDIKSLRVLSELAENFGLYKVKLDLKAQTFKEFSTHDTVKPTDTILCYGADPSYLPEVLQGTLPTGANTVFSNIYTVFSKNYPILHEVFGKYLEDKIFSLYGYNLTLAWDPKSPRSKSREYDRFLFLAENRKNRI